MAVVVDFEGRKIFEKLEFTEDEISDKQSQSECVTGECKTREFVDALSASGIDYVFADNSISKGDRQEDERRAIEVALLHGKCLEAKNGSDQLVERSSLLVGMEEGTTASVALIMLPIHMKSHHQQTIQRFVEKAREAAETNGGGKLQIVCARKVDFRAERQTATDDEERAEEEGIRQILLSLPEGSCAIPSSEWKRAEILTYCLDKYTIADKLGFFMAIVVVDFEGRNIFENLELTEEYEISGNVHSPSPSEMRNAENKNYTSIQNFLKSICPVPEYPQFLRRADGQSQSLATESKTREFVEALKENGIGFLLTDNTTRKVVVDDLLGKPIGFLICDFDFFECIMLEQIYEDLQHKDSDFIWIWIPSAAPFYCGYGSYTRLFHCTPWATFPHPQLITDDFEGTIKFIYPCFVVLDKDGDIANHDALPLLLACGVKSYPFTQHTITENFSLVDSQSCLKFLMHGMNIVGRKQMESKITFLYSHYPRKWLEERYTGELPSSLLKELTQINGSFEVLYVGNFRPSELFEVAKLKQEYEDAIQSMCWPSLSFWDMIIFWYRLKYLTSKEIHDLNKESNIIMTTPHGVAQHLSGRAEWLILLDNCGLVTCYGEEVLLHISLSLQEDWDIEGTIKRRIKDELMNSLRRGECTPFVRKVFGDEIHDHPRHPQHPISVQVPTPWRIRVCDICRCRLSARRSYRCANCDWDMCCTCWKKHVPHHILQLILADLDQMLSVRLHQWAMEVDRRLSTDPTGPSSSRHMGLRNMESFFPRHPSRDPTGPSSSRHMGLGNMGSLFPGHPSRDPTAPSSSRSFAERSDDDSDEED